MDFKFRGDEGTIQKTCYEKPATEMHKQEGCVCKKKERAVYRERSVSLKGENLKLLNGGLRGSAKREGPYWNHEGVLSRGSCSNGNSHLC